MSMPVDVISQCMSVLQHIALNRKLPTTACDECGVSYATFDKYTTNIPELAAMRKDAEDRLYDQLADTLLHIDTDVEYGHSDPKIMSIKSKNIQWLISRRRQAKYGDKITNEHVITADREVIQALQAAKARSHGVGQLAGPIVEATVAQVKETLEEREARELAALI